MLRIQTSSCRLVALLCASVGVSVADAAQGPAGSPWTDVARSSLSPTLLAELPDRGRVLSLDLDVLREQLRGAPLESDTQAKHSGFVLNLPTPDGKFARFRVVESPIMEPALAAKFPAIRTYLGQGIDDPTATLRFDINETVFHAQTLSSRGTLLIDPLVQGEVTRYLSVAKVDARGAAAAIEHSDAPANAAHGAEGMDAAYAPAISSGGTLRRFRIAVAATGEYTAMTGGTVDSGLSNIVSAINRVSGIYEREVAVRFVVVAGNDTLVFTDAATDPYTSNTNIETLFSQNQATVDQRIGSANYDLGIVFYAGTSFKGEQGAACSVGSKARAVAGTTTTRIGDVFDVNFVAHAIGHVLSAQHTFNTVEQSCGQGRVAAHAFEPGTGSTLMGQAGFCGGQSLQRGSDDYFHRDSLTAILGFAATSCGEAIATGNTAPTVTAPSGFVIPARTAFELTATGSDVDGDTLTYVWEQFDLGASTAVGQISGDDGSRPILRSQPPSVSGKRVFPSLRYVQEFSSAPPVSDTPPGYDSPIFVGEFVPSTSRALNFRVTVRDNHAGGGGTNEASSTLTVNGNAGPMIVTAPTTEVTWAAGSSQAVTWNVAGANVAPIGTTHMRILLSLDNGVSFPITLAASVPNTGGTTVAIPANTPATNQARVRVEAVGNVYFDMSDRPFSITAADGNTPPTITVGARTNIVQGGPAVVANVATLADVETAPGALQVAISGAPRGLSASVANIGGAVRLTARADCSLVTTRDYPLILTVTDGANAVSSAGILVRVTNNLAPTFAGHADARAVRGTTTEIDPLAPPTDPESNLDHVEVAPSTLPGGGTLSAALDGTVTVTSTAATVIDHYPVRVTAVDACGDARTTKFDLHIVSPDAQLLLGNATVTSGNNLIEPGECNTLKIALNNDGGADATAVLGALTTNTPGVTITPASLAYPNVPAGGSATNAGFYRVSTDPGLACFGEIAFNQVVSFSGANSPTTLQFNLPVGRAPARDYVFTATTGQAPVQGVNRLFGSMEDDATVSVTLPSGFNTALYGTTIVGGTALTVSTNGNVQFDAQGTNAYFNAPLPVSTPPANGGTGVFPATKPTIFAYWDDLDLRDGANGIYTALTGTAPQRNFIIEWRGRTVNGLNLVSVALVLHEGRGDFDLVYNNGSGASGQRATIGVQSDSAGDRFTQYSHDTASVSAGTRLTATLAPGICTIGTAQCVVVPDLWFADDFE